jgi:hypothetical protein
MPWRWRQQVNIEVCLENEDMSRTAFYPDSGIVIQDFSVK